MLLFRSLEITDPRLAEKKKNPLKNFQKNIKVELVGKY